jgi:hypothetical protein
MAQRVQVILEDDLDGGTADETVTFALDGVAYEIDLKSGNAEKLRALFTPYVEKGRRTTKRGASSQRTPRSSAPARNGHAKVVRAWAKAEGLSVEGRGRVPAPIVEAFEADQLGDRSLLENLKKMPLYSDAALEAGQDEEDPGAPTAQPEDGAARPATVEITEDDRIKAAQVFSSNPASEAGIGHLRAARDNGGVFVRKGSAAPGIIKGLSARELGSEDRQRITGVGYAYLELVEQAAG